MKWIKELYSNHPLLGVGLGLYLFLQAIFNIIDTKDFPPLLDGIVLFLFITSLIFIAVGGVLYLSTGPKTTTFKSRVRYFFKGYWRSAKLALLLTLLLLIGMVLYALWLNLSFV